MKRQLSFFGIAFVTAWLGQFALAHWLAGRDVLAGLIAHFDLSSAFVLLTLLGLRLFLFACVPGWVLYLVARAAQLRWKRGKEAAA